MAFSQKVRFQPLPWRCFTVVAVALGLLIEEDAIAQLSLGEIAADYGDVPDTYGTG